MLAERGDPERARPLLEQAEDAAVQLGQGSVEQRARAIEARPGRP
jgi:hypothetical protein